MPIHTLNLIGCAKFQQNITGSLDFPGKGLSAIWLIEGKGMRIRSKRKKYNIGGTIASAIDSHLSTLTYEDLQELYDSHSKGNQLFNLLHNITNQTITSFIQSRGWESMDNRGELFKRLRSDGTYATIRSNAGACMGLIIINNGMYRGYTMGDIIIANNDNIIKELSPDLLHVSVIEQFLKHGISMKVRLLKGRTYNDPELYFLDEKGIGRNPLPVRRGGFDYFNNDFKSIPNYTLSDVRNNITSYIGYKYDNICSSISSLGFSFLPDICHKCNYSDITNIEGPLSLLSNNIGSILLNDTPHAQKDVYMTNYGTGKVLFESFQDRWLHDIIKSTKYVGKKKPIENDKFMLNIEHLMGYVGNTSWITTIHT